MIIRILSALLITMSTIFSSIGQIDFQDITYEESLKQAKTTGKNIFIDFRADWCKPYIAMKKTIFQNPNVGDLVNNNYIPLKVDVDYFAGMDLKEQYNVGVLPTVLIINSKGSVQRRLIGQKSAESLIEELDIQQNNTNTSPEVDYNKESEKKNSEPCGFRRWWTRTFRS